MVTSILAYEPFDPAFRDEPARHYAMLREQAPVYRSQQGYWVISRFADVKETTLKPDKFSSALVGQEAMSLGKDLDESVPFAEIASAMPVDLGELMNATLIVATDPPRHSDLKRIAMRGFTPKRLAEWHERISSYTAECLAGIEELPAWDVISRVAMPLPVAVISGILGASDGRRSDIKHWSDVIIESGQGDDRGSPKALLAMLGMLRDFSNYFVPIIDERRRNPGEDLISDIVRAEQNETVSAVEALMLILAMMVAGNETTTNLIGNMVVSLLENPDQLAMVQADPALIPNVIEETLRYRSPVQFGMRSPVEDIEVGGQLIRAGEPVCLVWASANRDPDQFDQPERFDIMRDNRSQLAFGHGIHFCLGAHLARREAAAALAVMLPDLAKRKLSDAPLRRLPSSLVYGYDRVELVRK